MMDNSPFNWRTRVRVYECDALGHVNNAVYLHYLEQSTAEAWEALDAAAWELRSLVMEYAAPAYAGDDLDVTAFAGGVEGDLLACRYRITRPADSRTILRARATWADPGDLKAASDTSVWPLTPVELPDVTPLRLPADRLNAQRYRWRHTVCGYELGGSGCANPVEVLRWVEEAKLVACEQVGWSLDRMFDNDLMIVQVRHDTEFRAPLRAGDTIEVVSRIRDLRLLKGTWCQEIYRLPPPGATDGGERQMVALDYSTGAFLNCAGRPNPAPKAMLGALLRGEP
jgi:acyl-CoA thioester hydrolase